MNLESARCHFSKGGAPVPGCRNSAVKSTREIIAKCRAASASDIASGPTATEPPFQLSATGEPANLAPEGLKEARQEETRENAREITEADATANGT
jgi:hypothetical protein